MQGTLGGVYINPDLRTTRKFIQSDPTTGKTLTVKSQNNAFDLIHTRRAANRAWSLQAVQGGDLHGKTSQKTTNSEKIFGHRPEHLPVPYYFLSDAIGPVYQTDRVW